MAEDFDVEALLEAPYNSNTNGTTDYNNQKIRLEDDERKHSKRSRSRSRERKHKRRSRSKERKSRRSRSRSHERRHKRDRHSSKDRSRSREKRSRSRDRHRRRSRDRYDDRHSRRYRDDSYSRSPIYKEDRILEEADKRTVFCMQLAARVRPRDLEDFFSKVGKVKEVRLIMDNKTRKHKGIAYIEFRDSSSVSLALQLNGQKLCGYPISVQPTNAEKNKSTSNPLPNSSSSIISSSLSSLPSSINAKKQLISSYQSNGPLRLYVGSLPINSTINEDTIRSIFEPFGKIIKIELIRDEALRSKGYGFVTFANQQDGKEALAQLNGYELAGRPMKVAHVTEREGSSSSNHSTAGQPTLDSDELDRTGIPVSTTGRLQLMAKLAEGTGIELPKSIVNALNQYSITGSVIAKNNSTAASNSEQPVSTQCFMLNNMFDPSTETDENWPEQIKEEVAEECRAHGGAVHVYVDAKSQGNVYVKASSIAAAAKCVAALHGRWFSGKLVTAAYVLVNQYHQLFPESLTASKIL